MKKVIDAKLAEARPEYIKGNYSFVKNTMEAVQRAASGETFAAQLRITNDTKKGSFRMYATKLQTYYKQLPRLAAIALIIGSTGTVGAAGYITYKWITPNAAVKRVQPSNDDGRKQFTIDGQCGAYRSGKNLQYELAKNTSLTDMQVEQVFKSTCAYDAVSSFIDAHFISDNDSASVAHKKSGDIITIYNHDNVFAGNDKANPAFGLTTGRITSLSNSSITYELPIYSVDQSANNQSQPIVYYPEGKIVQRTLPLSTNLKVWSMGTSLSVGDIHVGDLVQVVTRTQNEVKYYQDIHQNGLGAQTLLDVAGIVKLDFDPSFVAIGGSQIGNPAIVNTIASLDPCTGNGNYLCVSAPKQVLGQIYATGDLNTNHKYVHKDAYSNKVKSYRLDGRLVKAEGNMLTLTTRGKRANFTIELPYGAVTNFNKTSKLKLTPGDLVSAIYVQLPQENHLRIKSGDIQNLSLVEQIQPDGSIIEY